MAAASNPADCMIAEANRIQTSCCVVTAWVPGSHMHPAAAELDRLDMNCSSSVLDTDTAIAAHAAVHTLAHTVIDSLHFAAVDGNCCIGRSSPVAAADHVGNDHPGCTTWRRYFSLSSRRRLIMRLVSMSCSAEAVQSLGRVVKSWWNPASRRAARKGARNRHRVLVGAQTVEVQSRRCARGYGRAANVWVVRLPIA